MLAGFNSIWRKLSVHDGLPYPSSAVFASEMLEGNITLATCEADSQTADAIAGWLALPQQRGIVKSC
jgi:hypothetical protein